MLNKHGFKDHEVIEIARDNAGNYVMGKTGYPSPAHRYRFVLEDYNSSIEEIYYWITDNITVSEGFPNVIKISDVFTATEQSSFFGSAQQRVGLQQEKVSMFLATIGKMVKELFQIVRELRIIDERRGYYEDSFNNESKSRISAEIVLKGIWVDQVEGGPKNPASVYGMARELQFTTLPDLFFSLHPKSIADIDKDVEALDFNVKVKEVLKRKIRSFMQWKQSTYGELHNRRVFTLKYLRQHFDIINMYVAWVKPYLRNLRRMNMVDRTDSPDLVSAFDGSIIEIENLFYKLPPSHGTAKYMRHNEHVNSVVIISFKFRNKPQMNFQQEYQRGPLHVGQADVSIRAYAWTKDQIDKYVKMRRQEDIELLSAIDGSVKAALESLGQELEDYLNEAGEGVIFEKEQKEQKIKDRLRDKDPFVSLLYGFKEMFYDSFKNPLGTAKKKDGKPIVNPVIMESETAVAKGNASKVCWSVYKNFKKSHGMLAW